MPEAKPPCSYHIEREDSERNLIVNCIGCWFYPSIEENEICMERVINYLIESGHMSSVILSSERNYVYPEEQTRLLNEIADVYVYLLKERNVLSYRRLIVDKYSMKYLPSWLGTLRRIVMDLIRRDPIGAYVETLRVIRIQKVNLEKEKPELKPSFENYIHILEEILNALEKTSLIKQVKPYLPGYKIGNREIYRRIFEPMIRPNFMYTRLMAEPPLRGEEIESYEIGEKDKSQVTIYKLPDKTSLLYHIIPPEFQINEEEYVLLDEAREILVKYKPKEREFTDPQRMREVFFNISRDLIEEIANNKGIKLTFNQVEQLARILVRLTVGFGLTEVLLQDDYIEDIYINAPIGRIPIFVKHSKYGECYTNIIPNVKEAEAWVSRFRMISGRPLDEANPVLDTELITPEARARAGIIQPPLSPKGYSFAFRKHREKPWTIPLFIKERMLTPLCGGLLWFCVDGARTILVGGTRGSGKTSLLASLIGEMMRRYRILTVEDTLELPVDYFRDLGYNIVSMKVRSAIVGEKSEMSAEEGIRTSLRLGDSCLVIGEVRSRESVALYEAMRIGALANVVMGTIHGESPYGIFDRVVNDLGVPRTSFKATDLVILCNKIRTPAQIFDVRRVVQITEVRKHWMEDPLKEKGFINLMEYDVRDDEIKPTKDLIEGESEVIKAIAARVRHWAGNWDAVWENITLRARIKQMLVDYSTKLNNNEMLEADFVVEANDQFHKIFEDLTEKTGYPESKDVLYRFENWLKLRLKGKEIERG
jgi:type IV secretory pathway ATPase VirB11/archaellum biosynthesis ATPase